MEGKRILLLAFGCVLMCFAPQVARAGVTFTNLVVFNGTNGDVPRGKLLLGADGNFYGVTATGGANGGYWGTVFQMAPNGTLNTLALFDGTNGDYPCAGLVSDAEGNLYGTTLSGGTPASGFNGNVFTAIP
jgi:hypothetical protein